MRPLTDDKPKCLVPLLGSPLLDHQLASIRYCGVNEIYLVTGYASGALVRYGAERFHNPDYATSNMVASLFKAASLFDGSDDLIIAYSDIVYEPLVLRTLMDAPSGIVTLIDKGWNDLWRARMEDPLSDAETLKLAPDGRLLEIGKKPTSMDEIEGQYIGLTKVSKDAQLKVRAFYEGLDREETYDGQPFANMYMTSFLQLLIDAGYPILSAPVSNGWLEVDTPQDLETYEAMQAAGTLATLWRPQGLTEHTAA